MLQISGLRGCNEEYVIWHKINFEVLENLSILWRGHTSFLGCWPSCCWLILLNNMTQLFWLRVKTAFWRWILLHSQNQFHFVEIVETRSDAAFHNYFTTIWWCVKICINIRTKCTYFYADSIAKCRNCAQYCKISRVGQVKQRDDKSALQTIPLREMLSVFLNWT